MFCISPYMFLYYISPLYIIIYFYLKGLRDCSRDSLSIRKNPASISTTVTGAMAKWLFPNLPCSWMWLYQNKRKYIKLLVQKSEKGKK